MKRKLTSKNIVILIVVLLILLAAYTMSVISTEVEPTKDHDEIMDDSVLNIEADSSELSIKNKDQLIDEYTDKLTNGQNRSILYGDYIDESHYVYVLTDQIEHKREKMMIVCLDKDEVKLVFEAGVLDDEIGLSWEIQKLYLNRLEDSEMSNVSVVFSNDKYTKAQVFELNKEEQEIRYSGFYKVDNVSGKSFGDKTFKYILNLEDEACYSKI